MQEQPPPLKEKLRMPLRIAVVIGGYLIVYALVPDRTIARLFLWAGITILGWLLVDRATMWARERSGMMVAGATILGLGLGGIGLYLTLR
jgi:hypothetical protein